MFKKRPTFFRYLPLSPDDRPWGIFVTTAGHARSHPESAGYPPDKHPSAYHFEWEHGRILNEFQILHIVRGQGLFESATHGEVKIKGGEALLLFPGEWHRYKPNPKTGWDECWIGLDGAIPRQLVEKKIFRAATPVFTPEDDGAALQELYLQAIEALELEPPGYPQILAGLAYQMLTLLHAFARGTGKKTTQNDLIARLLKIAINDHLAEKIDWSEAAKSLGVSYSTMRHAFRKHTGLSPHQYQIQQRLNKARLLMNTTEDSLKTIAQAVGFDCPFHFAHLFKRKIGRSPGDWRMAARGGNWVEKNGPKNTRRRSSQTKGKLPSRSDAVSAGTTI
jgi:AraC-like DNA-binding protein